MRDSDRLTESRFRVMGSDAHVMVVSRTEGWAAQGLIELARARLEHLESIWSRFRPESELSQANRHAGEWVLVSPETVGLVERALVARSRTSGLYDPTRLSDVVAAGYSASFEHVGVHVGVDGTSSPAADGSTHQVDVDAVGGRVRVAPGCGVDPGGIGKGFAADLVVGELLDAGAAGASVNVGGDVRVSGTGPVSGDWIVAVEDPTADDGASIVELVLADGAVATSSRLRRSWTTADGGPAHHLIDPRTGRPASTSVLSSTVVAAEGWQAEVLAKAAFLGGPAGLAGQLQPFGATGLLITEEGPVYAPGLDRFRATTTA